MPIVSLQHGVHNASAEHVRTVNSEMQLVINRIGGEAEAAMAHWAGSAGGQFQTLMARYNEAAKKLQTVLLQIADGIQNNGKAYDSSEEQNLSRLTHISGGVDAPLEGI
jgi:WXG100 family type VII secretion target